MTCAPSLPMWRTTSTAGAPTATGCGWRRPPGMPQKTGTTPLPPPCSSPPIRTTRPSGLPPRLWGRNTGWSFCTGTSAPCSRPGRSSPGSTGFTCRNTAAASSARRTGTWPPSGRRRPERPPKSFWPEKNQAASGSGAGAMSPVRSSIRSTTVAPAGGWVAGAVLVR